MDRHEVIVELLAPARIRAKAKSLAPNLAFPEPSRAAFCENVIVTRNVVASPQIFQRESSSSSSPWTFAPPKAQWLSCFIIKRHRSLFPIRNVDVHIAQNPLIPAGTCAIIFALPLTASPTSCSQTTVKLHDEQLAGCGQRHRRSVNGSAAIQACGAKSRPS
ncbi:hypothetical protein [Schlesneria paludicola]|uniref:hypothetical protein n=1 Tax=Schlesneria paludicola TaxID=360056 RepID=UPI00029AE542|nr:hypothetical protein [Schlesneria paludicola]